MAHYSLTVGSFIAAFLVLIPLPSHWRARNVATLSLIAWLFVVDMIFGIDSAVWTNNVEIRLTVWCDIVTKIIVGSSSALPAATLCICKHLELVASGRMVRLSNSDKRRRMFFELAMCFGLPMTLMALHYIVQGHRFDIVEDIGCLPETDYTVPALFIICLPPLVLSIITLIYAALALRHFFKQRMTFTTQLQKSHSALTTGRYLRLIAMSITEMVWGTSLSALSMYDNVSPGLEPYTSWQVVHVDFSRIGQYPLVLFPATYVTQLFLFEWAIPASSFIFFIFFGFGEESMKDYSKMITWVRRHVFRQRLNEQRFPNDKFGFNRPPRVAVDTFAVVEVFGDSTDGQKPPAYSPPAGRKILPSLPSKTDVDTVETESEPWDYKDLPSPSIASTRATASRSLQRISISDAYPPSQPPSLPSSPLPTHTSTAELVHSRPVSSPPGIALTLLPDARVECARPVRGDAVPDAGDMV